MQNELCVSQTFNGQHGFRAISFPHASYVSMHENPLNYSRHWTYALHDELILLDACSVYKQNFSHIFIINSIIYTYLCKTRALTRSLQANSSLCNQSYKGGNSFILCASHDVVAKAASIREELKKHFFSQATYASLVHQTLHKAQTLSTV